MLGISAISGGGEGYYVEAVAKGIDEYYRGVGEAPGWWGGTAAGVELGLAGEVRSEDLKALLAGLDPATGEPLGRFTNRTVTAFDLCWRAPKSVSLLFAFGDADTSRTVRDAHDAAAAEALRYLESTAARTRLGHGGMRSEPVDGFVAAMFRHRTSRTGDPHLHTHVLVANMAKAADGQWRTLDGRMLYRHAKSAGHLYQAHLRHELTRQLGVEWTPVEKGTADIVGIDRSVIMEFSERRRQIIEHLDTVGFRSARAAQIATLETRPDKTELPEGTIRDLWEAKAAAIGVEPNFVDQALGIAAHEQRMPSRDSLFTDLASPVGVTEQRSTFDRPDVLRAIADRLPAGAHVSDIEAMADQFLDLAEVVALGERHGFAHDIAYTTAELIHLEERLITSAVARVGHSMAMASPTLVDVVIAHHPSIAAEQADLVVRLCTESDGVAVVTAAAGTGKTFALGVAQEVWQQAGCEVVGACVSAKAARGLEEATDIPSFTLTRLTDDLDSGRLRLRLGESWVVVIDEAGMAGTRELARVLDAAAETGAKVVLVGDDRQLPEITAGGLFGALTRTLEPIELGENRRQIEPWEREALGQFRSGDVDLALNAFEEHGRVVTGADASGVRQSIADDWWEQTRRGVDVAMLAPRRSDVDDLNGRARLHMEAAGRVCGPTLNLDDRPFQAGDQIICLRNDYQLGVRNGDRMVVERVDVDSTSMIVRGPDGTRTLPPEYLERGEVAHGYATTIHKAQGMTVDVSLVLGTDELHRESGYVAMSRGIESNMLYVVGGVERDVDITHGPERTAQDPKKLVTDALHKSQGKELAIESLMPIEDLLNRFNQIEVEPAEPVEAPSQADDFDLGI